MKLSILGSGSSGNSIYVEKDDTAFLIDAGFSCKKIEERLVAANADINKIRAILITKSPLKFNKKFEIWNVKSTKHF